MKNDAQQKIEVTINYDFATAKEVNPYKDQLDKEERLGYNLSFGLAESWRSYENGLRTFEIETINGVPESIFAAIPSLTGYEPGTRHYAEILPNGKIKIL